MTPHRRPFEVGERVRAYSGHHTYAGKITGISEDGSLLTIEYGHRFHRNQCRRLKKKEPLIEFWMNIYSDGGFCSYKSKAEADQLANSHRIRCVLLREVKS